MATGDRPSFFAPATLIAWLIIPRCSPLLRLCSLHEPRGWWIRQRTGLAEDGAVDGHRHLSDFGDPDREVASAGA